MKAMLAELVDEDSELISVYYGADVSQEDVDNKTYKKSKYMIEDVVTRAEINTQAALPTAFRQFWDLEEETHV